jgi:thiol-disulfide isomerase/thioredoxin
MPAGLAAALALTLLVGCGGSDPETPPASDVVSPPVPSSAASEAPAEPGDAPGAIEMPPGGISETPAGGEPEPSAGLELPSGTVIPEDSTTPDPPTGGADDGQAAASSGVRYATWPEIEQIAKASGKVTVVDLWSLACEPCLKEFPGLVRLHQSLGDTVECLAVDVDFDGRKTRPPTYYEPRVAEFLEGVGAQFTTFISETPSDEVYAATDLDSIPAVLIYDAQGELVKVFADSGETAGFTYDKDIIPLVQQLAG